MITVNTFFSGTLNTVDAVIGNFVNVAYMHFVQSNARVITLLFTFYIMMLGYQFLTHNSNFNMMVVIKRLVTMLCVYGLVMNMRLYHLFIYNIFTNEPAYISDILVKSAGHYQMSGNIAETLDGLYEAVMAASSSFFGQISFSTSGIAFLFYGILVFIIGSLTCIFALLLFVYAKMMLAVSLALGPMFILFILWEPTKGMFNSWMQKLVTMALIPVVTSAILVLMLSVVNVTLVGIKQPIGHLHFSGIAPFLGLSLSTSMMLSQVFRICSALGGGLTLASISKGASVVSSVARSVGNVANHGRPKSLEERVARHRAIESALERYARGK